jgi:hypothetical protein
MRHIRITSVGSDGTRPEGCSMTGINVTFTEAEASDYSLCYAKALDFIVSELKRYALQEAMAGIGIRPPPSHHQ